MVLLKMSPFIGPEPFCRISKDYKSWDYSKKNFKNEKQTKVIGIAIQIGTKVEYYKRIINF